MATPQTPDRLTQALLATLPATPASWMAEEAQKKALSAFEHQGAPTLRTEAWKFTPLRGLDKRLAAPEIAPSPAHLVPLEGATVIAMPGGVPASALPTVDGVFLDRLSTLVAAEHEVVTRHMGTVAQTALRPFEALNTAAGADGLLIHVAAGQRAVQPLHLLYTPGATAQAMAATRLLIVLEEGAALSLLEEWRGVSAALVNTVVEVRLAANAKLNHLRLQALPESETSVAATLVDLDRDAYYDGFSLATGARLARHDVHARLLGANAEARLDGLNLATGRQHLDTASYIEHAVPHTRSDQTYRTVLAGHATGVFQGKIKVHKDAQKTDGYQLNRALLLSDNATMNAKPELEIFADDVKCSHGATTGQLSADELFYLRARGIPLAEAKRLLVAGFMAESLELIAHEGLRAVAAREVDAWMDALVAAETAPLAAE